MKLHALSLLLLLFSTTAFGGPLRKEVETLLPQELIDVLKSTDAVKAQATFKKKIFKKDQDALYLNYFGTKGDTTLGLKENQVVYVYAEITEETRKKKPNLYVEALNTLTKEEKEKLSKKMSMDTSHDKGRFIVIDLPKESMKLEFYNDEKKSLHSVLIWSLGSKAP